MASLSSDPHCGLPPDWEVVVSEYGSEHVYYWNRLTNETTWQKPVAAAPDLRTRWSAERSDYHAVQMLPLQMQQMQPMGQLMQQFAQTQQKREHEWDGHGRHAEHAEHAAQVPRGEGDGQQVQGPAKRNVEINKQITVCKDS